MSRYMLFIFVLLSISLHTCAQEELVKSKIQNVFEQISESYAVNVLCKSIKTAHTFFSITPVVCCTVVAGVFGYYCFFHTKEVKRMQDHAKDIKEIYVLSHTVHGIENIILQQEMAQNTLLNEISVIDGTVDKVRDTVNQNYASEKQLLDQFKMSNESRYKEISARTLSFVSLVTYGLEQVCNRTHKLLFKNEVFLKKAIWQNFAHFNKDFDMQADRLLTRIKGIQYMPFTNNRALRIAELPNGGTEKKKGNESALITASSVV